MKTINTDRGFTLIELAVVMLIIALLIGGMLLPLGTRFDAQAYADTRSKLDKVNEALVGFAVLNNRLPCPGDMNGAELPRVPIATPNLCGSAASSDSANVADSNTSWGIVPWQTLGLSETDVEDSWGYRLRYSVRTRLALDNSLNQTNLPPSSPAVFASPTGIMVLPTNTSIAPLTTTALYVLSSTGKNGTGGNRSGTNPLDAASYNLRPVTTSTDERSNLARDDTANTAAARSRFVSRVRTEVDGSLGEFDDVVIWMSPTTLTAKLVAAGVWTP